MRVPSASSAYFLQSQFFSSSSLYLRLQILTPTEISCIDLQKKKKNCTKILALYLFNLSIFFRKELLLLDCPKAYNMKFKVL